VPVRLDVKGYAEINAGRIRRAVVHSTPDCTAIRHGGAYYIRIVSAPSNEQPNTGLMLCRSCHAIPENEVERIPESVLRVLGKEDLEPVAV
jgi:hypothetical protein